MRAVTGSAEISGQVDYDPKTAEFFFKEPSLENFSLAGLPGKYVDQTKSVVDALGKEALNRLPLYKLQQSDRYQALAKLFLKSVAVSHGKLRITMGLKASA